MCRLSWFLDPGGWSKTAAVRLYFIFPGICTLSLKSTVLPGSRSIRLSFHHMGGRARWIFEFEANLVYRTGSRKGTKTTQSNPVFKNNSNNKEIYGVLFTFANFIPKVSIILIPYQGSFSLQQLETNTEKKAQSNKRVVKPSLSGYI
ncbi:hypothetical protein STEG23_025518 [Scotinomys teguina]